VVQAALAEAEERLSAEEKVLAADAAQS